MFKINQVKLFLLLSFLSGLFELGIIVMGISDGFEPIKIAAMGLAYQMGNLVPIPFDVGQKTLKGANALNIVIIIFYVYLHIYILLLISITLMGATIQKLRSKEKGNVSTTIKRGMRIIGFVFSGLVTPNSIVAIALLLFILLCLEKKEFLEKNRLIIPRFSLMNFVMFTHQIHYFCYSYFAIILISTVVESKLLVIIFFIISWLTYVSVPHILKKNTPFKYLVGGHLFLIILLGLMFLLIHNNVDNFIVAVLWGLTGFGGGTVFCIDKINSNLYKYAISKEEMTFSENIGHVLGVIIGIVTVSLLHKLEVTFLVAAFFALITILLMYILLKKDRKVGESYD